jgi:hypothetical protein
MSRTLSRLLTLLGLGPKPASPSVARAFDLAASQQALFQLEFQQGKSQCQHHYLSFSRLTPEGVVLVFPDPSCMAHPSWTNRTFLFRFLVEPDPAKPPLLHKFRSTILGVAKDKRSVTVALPKSIIVLEQRRNVRIRLHRRHMPHMVIWGVQKNYGETKGVSLNHHVILDLPPSGDEIARSLKNISAGGMRLSLSPKVLNQNKERLEEGRKLIVQLVFSNSTSQETKHLFVSKVCNTRVQEGARPELGIQFLASRIHDPHARWKELENDGCEHLARVIHSIQVQYYAEIKQRLAIREGTLSASPGVDLHPRRNI